VSAPDAAAVPSAYRLMTAAPNPFNPSTRIGFELPHGGHVRLEVLNALGQRVALLVDEAREAGRHEVRFQPKALASVYYYRLESREFHATRRMTLPK